MQFASPSQRLALAGGELWGRARSSVRGGVLWSALIVFLLAYAVASSTSTAGWVPGIEVIQLVALGGAVLMAVLAVLPVPWPAGLGLGMILGPIVATNSTSRSPPDSLQRPAACGRTARALMDQCSRHNIPPAIRSS